MTLKSLKLQTCAPIAIFALVATPALAGAFDKVPLEDVTGDGIVFVDTDEGVLEPGMQSFTDEPGVSYDNTSNPNGVENCLVAYSPALEEDGCNSPRGSGKRFKTYLTGPDGMDISLSTQSTGNVTEYYAYGKTSNMTGARMVGFTLELGTGTGAEFVAFDTEDPTYAALFDTEFTGGKFNLPDGLFGNGGHGADTGFFDDGDKAVMSTNQLTAALIELGEITGNTEYAALFGDGFLDDSQVPDGFFFDTSSFDEEADEPALIAWYNVGSGAWVYGTIGVEGDALDEKLQHLADTLDVGLGELGYVPGDEVPAEIISRMETSDLMSVDIIEDLRNMNLNFMIQLGDVNGELVTLRLVPVFAEIVAEAASEYQFKVAGMLDAAAEVPYLDIGNAETYEAAVDEIVGLDAADQQTALESVGFSFLGSYGSLAYELGRTMTVALPDGGISQEASGVTLSTKGLPNGWSISDNVTGFVTVEGGTASYDRTVNGAGYDIDSYAMNAGAEWSLDPTLGLGVMIGVGSGTADAQADLGSVDADALSIAIFGRKAFGDGGLVSAMIGYQDLSFDSRRNVMGETAKAETDGSQIFAALNAQYMFQNGAFSYGPQASLEYYAQKVDGFDETGADAWNLSIGDQDGKVTIASVGLAGAYALSDSRGDTLLTGAVSLTTASGDDQMIATGFVGLPTTTVPVDGFDDQWVDLDLGFATTLGASPTSRTTLQGGYHGAFGSDYERHSLQLSVNFAF
nr:choice-of-anchor F family protein [uncultured Celeribacter sp.]